jgi:hypothetical protein
MPIFLNKIGVYPIIPYDNECSLSYDVQLLNKTNIHGINHDKYFSSL